MKVFILVAILFSIFDEGYSYPIFFQCKESQITYKGKLEDNNIFEQLLLLDEQKQNEQIVAWCKGSEDCLKDFKFITEIAGLNYKMAEELFLEEITKIEVNFKPTNFSIDDLESLNKLKNNYTSLRACQNAKTKLDPEDFLIEYGSSVLTTYPYYSNYMYITGCQGVDSESCPPISKSHLDRVIKESILMGVDPYLVLSLSLMEGGTGKVGELYLDPIGVMSALGCSAKQIANKTNNPKALNSYGTNYIVESQIVENNKLQKKISNYFEAFSLKKEEGNSFYCYDTKGSSAPSIFDKPQSNSCCLELGFKTTNNMNYKIKHALTYHFIDSITKNSFKEKKDPAWRVQRYNGYSNLMGAAERVSPWRAGVNHYEDPIYGYQTMDFIINSLMFNPYISQQVDNLKNGLDARWDSILCKDKQDGTYYIDSDYYFNKHKDTPRLKSIYEKYKNGYSFDELTSREREVLLAEMEETASKNSKMPNRLPRYKENKVRQKLYNTLSFGSEGTFEIFKYSVLPKDEWKKAILGGHDLEEYELDAIYNYIIEGKEISKKYDEINKENNRLFKQAKEICDKIEDTQKITTCNLRRSKLASYIYSDNENFEISIKGSPLEEFEPKFLALGKNYKELDKKEEQRQHTFYDKFNYLKLKQKVFEFAAMTIDKIEPLEMALKRHAKNKNFNSKLKSQIEIYYSSIKNKNEVYSQDEAYKEYFNSIYKDRSTIQGSSVYPWRKFNAEEVSKLVEHFKRYKY